MRRCYLVMAQDRWLPYGLFPKYWEVFKADIMNVFSDFYLTVKFARNLNSTFLVLVPKFEGSMEVKGFWTDKFC